MMLPTAALGKIEDAVRHSRLAQIASTPQRATIHAMRSDSALPLLVEAISSATDLVEWATWHREELNARLRESGGILFRGFRIDGPERLESLIKSFSGRLLDYSYRSTPRTVVSGKIYTSTEYPPHQTIPLHNENAYAHDWPMKIWFFSLQCASSGGETPSQTAVACIDAFRQRFANVLLGLGSPMFATTEVGSIFPGRKYFRRPAGLT
jgi:hypothetical protein